MRVYYLCYMQKRRSRVRAEPRAYQTDTSSSVQQEQVREVLSDKSTRGVGEAHGGNPSVIHK